jgi:hypothetical protein
MFYGLVKPLPSMFCKAPGEPIRTNWMIHPTLWARTRPLHNIKGWFNNLKTNSLTNTSVSSSLKDYVI